MALFNRRARGLQSLFPSSGTSKAQPNEVTDNVQLISEFPTPAIDLERVRIIEFLSASNVTPVLSIAPAAGEDPANGTPVVGSDFYDEWLFGDVRQTSAAGASPTLTLLGNAPGSLTTYKLGVWKWDSADAVVAGIVPLYVSAAIVGTGFNFYWPMRPILVPPGWTYVLSGSTAAVAYTVALRLGIIRRPLAQRLLFSTG